MIGSISAGRWSQTESNRTVPDDFGLACGLSFRLLFVTFCVWHLPPARNPQADQTTWHMVFVIAHDNIHFQDIAIKATCCTQVDFL